MAPHPDSLTDAERSRAAAAAVEAVRAALEGPTGTRFTDPEHEE
jgi:hypothetical protein